jgi:WD40 repeat protein
VRHVELSQDETKLLSWDFSDSIRIWDLKTLELEHIIDCSMKDGNLSYARFDEQGASIISFQHNSLYVWDVSSGECLCETPLDIVADDISGKCQWIGGKYVLYDSYFSNKQYLIDRKTGNVIKQFSNKTITISPRENHLAVMDESGIIYI